MNRYLEDYKSITFRLWNVGFAFEDPKRFDFGILILKISKRKHFDFGIVMLKISKRKHFDFGILIALLEAQNASTWNRYFEDFKAKTFRLWNLDFAFEGPKRFDFEILIFEGFKTKTF